MNQNAIDPAGWQHAIALREANLFASYAMHSANSAGRVHAEPDQPYRGPFQRDRDRILHSSAFRRLSGKTQVFTGLGDYHRTRLTHTMEVSSIARTIGRTLRLNEDLIEALALLHDIGHPPFGHAGEDALNEFLADEVGFSHNQYALTLVEELERPYPGFAGINLSREVLQGQRFRINKTDSTNWPLLEVQTVDLADSISYDAHDMDDAVKLGWLQLDELLELPLVSNCHEAVISQFGNLSDRALRRALVHELINCQVQNVIAEATSALAPFQGTSAAEIQAAKLRFCHSPTMAIQKEALERFLYERLYRHADLVQARREAQHKLSAMADFFCDSPHELPRAYQRRIDQHGERRSVVDYLAGMTDSFCLRQYVRLQLERR